MKFLRDTWLIFQRQAQLFWRSPFGAVVGVIQPLCYLLLFAPLLRPALGVGNSAQAYRIFVPGLLVLLTMFASLFVGMGLLGEIRDGVLDRSRVTPVSRMALLLGRSLRDMVVILLQATVLIVVALPFGLRVQVGDLLLAYLLLGVVTIGLSAFSYALALKLRSIRAVSPLIQLLSQNLLLLSGVLLPIAFAPHWLRAIAAWNPLTYVVAGSRALFGGVIAATSVWQALAVSVALAALTVTWASRAFARGLR
jgi:ABC-2 type transport system permease protein